MTDKPIFRRGNFTSSQAYKLISEGRVKGSIGAPFHTYVEEKVFERLLNRSLETDVYSRPMAWGNIMELYVRDKVLDFNYKHFGDIPVQHPTHPYWVGSPDFTIPDVLVSELKCYEPKKFCSYANALIRGDVSELRDNFKQEYWQIISNAAILNLKKGEAMAFMPSADDLEAIRDYAANYDNAEQWKYRFIFESEDKDLNHVPKGSFYKPLNSFKFDIPDEDVEFLTGRIIMAEYEANKRINEIKKGKS